MGLHGVTWGRIVSHGGHGVTTWDHVGSHAHLGDLGERHDAARALRPARRWNAWGQRTVKEEQARVRESRGGGRRGLPARDGFGSPKL
eukprot:3958230-Prymnesium_polylepis.2